MIDDLNSYLSGMLQNPEKSEVVPSKFQPSHSDDSLEKQDLECAIIVTGFDEATKEEELIAFYYQMTYGGGTRNVNDGKVHSCQIIQVSDFSSLS